MVNAMYVSVTPRKAALDWLQPGIVEVCNGVIKLKNSSQIPIQVRKSDHLADVRTTTVFSLDNNMARGKFVPEDKFQFKDLAKSRLYSKDYVKQINVDPDGILSPDQREIFHGIHKQFAQLFTPQPGRYNGYWRYVDNKLKFSTPPPPNSKTTICLLPSITDSFKTVEYL